MDLSKESDYRCKSYIETQNIVLEMAAQVENTLGFRNAIAECVALLVAANLNVEQAPDVFYDNCPEKFANGDNHNNHYSVPWGDERKGHLIANTELCYCHVCYDELKPGQGRTFCKHFHCSECFAEKLRSYCNNFITLGRRALVFRCNDCVSPTCFGMTLISRIEIDLRSFLPPSFDLDGFMKRHLHMWCHALQNYSCFLGKNSVTKMSQIRQNQEIKDKEYMHRRFVVCSTDNCPNVFFIDKISYVKGLKSGTCNECKKMTCFLCGLSAHSPANCLMVELWNDKDNDTLLNLHYIASNSDIKPCPKCKFNILKNGGCNHMKCIKCHHEFCWVCLGLWSEHNNSFYKCNRPIVKKENTYSDPHKDRFAHYYERYENHKKSMRLDQVTMDAVCLYTKTHYSDIGNLSYLEDVAKTLFECRETLMNTYIYAFYETNDIFEFNQGQLEKSTEDLSEIVELCVKNEDPTQSRQSICDKANLAMSFLNILRKGK